jgi:protein SDA1
MSGVFQKGGARKGDDTAAEELRAMLRRADKSAVADRRVDPDALAAIGLKHAHDKESRVASIMAGREGRTEAGLCTLKSRIKLTLDPWPIASYNLSNP